MNLKIKDLITTGIFAGLYFIFVAIGTLIGVVIIHNANMVLAPICTALIAGAVYLLLVEKVQKFGAITIVGIVMAVFFFVSGHFILSFIPSLVFAMLADMIAGIKRYKNKVTNIISYIVFSFGNLGPIVLMWFARDAYINRLVEKGKDATYINNVMVDFNTQTFLTLFFGIIVAGLIGGLIGQYLIDKHFKKAGYIE